MQWPQRCILTGILLSIVILPLLEMIKPWATEMTIQFNESALSFNSNVVKSQKVYRFQAPFTFDMNPIPSVFATDPDSICPVQSILCVECRSDKHPYCRDPFNRTLLNFNDIPFKLCFGYCVKWIRGPINEGD
ncbi:unnamed protein product [Rodentolepis nana]|uniref:Protein quiver n=1 Tax=Rodentolepis nana TaxID=102285 RepID=A0A0R3TYG6_RODNA|nr:unnamed protein product [Rodentolepis nana]